MIDSNSPSDARDERLARNEVTFRNVNESIAQLATGFGVDDPYQFICECADAGCFERLTLTRQQYERVRSDAETFFVKPGHQNDEIEEVIERQPGFLVVRKFGVAGVVAERASGTPPIGGDLG